MLREFDRKFWGTYECAYCRQHGLADKIRGRWCLKERDLKERPVVRELRDGRLEFYSTGDVWDFLRECEEEAPDRYDPVEIVRTVVGICPLSFVTQQTEYLLSIVGLFTNEGGIQMLPYPAMGIDNPALFFQAAVAVLDEQNRAQREHAEKKQKGGDK